MPAATPVVPIIASVPATPRPPDTSPQRSRGMLYAIDFAEGLVGSIRNQISAPLTMPVAHLTMLAREWYGPAVSLAPPVDRNLLGAIKRLPGVSVQQDVRAAGSIHTGHRPKTTMHTIHPLVTGTQGEVATTVERHAA